MALLLGAPGTLVAAGAVPKPKSNTGRQPETAPKAVPNAKPPAKGPQSFGALIDAMRDSPGLSARFVERKEIALLARPLVSEGSLYFSRPNALARYVDRPTASILLVSAGKVRIYDGSRWSAIDLRAKPVVRSFVESFVVLIAGDAGALERYYQVQFSAEATGWHLVLRPKGKPLDAVIRRIELWGRANIVQRMRLEEVEGDVTTTTFTDVVPNRRFDAEERRAIFAPAGS